MSGMNWKSKDEIYSIEPKRTASHSSAAGFCRILAYITWIGGLIIAITGSKTTSISGYSVQEEFSFTLLLTSLVTYGVVGGLLFCVAELLENIQSIADSLKGMKVTMNLNDEQPLSNQMSSPAATDQPVTGEQKEEKVADKRLFASEIKQVLAELEQENVEWVPVEQLGELGKRMEANGVLRRKQEYAPENMSEDEALRAGYGSWIMDGNKRQHFRGVILVPNLTEEEWARMVERKEAK